MLNFLAGIAKGFSASSVPCICLMTRETGYRAKWLASAGLCKFAHLYGYRLLRQSLFNVSLHSIVKMFKKKGLPKGSPSLGRKCV